MRLILILLSTALLTASAAITAARDVGVLSKESDEATEAKPIGGHFILVDQNGKTVLDEDYRGSFLLITFGYTHCPDVCPTTLQGMASALDILGPDGAKVRPIFITVDPNRDTPAVLKDYTESFGPRFVGLTGPEAYIADAAAKFKIKYSKVENATLGYSIDHTAGIFLMGPDGSFLARFPHDLAPDLLAARLRERLKAGAQ
ncbi:MAG: SCO family protein [Rhodomicrobium sp.]